MKKLILTLTCLFFLLSVVMAQTKKHTVTGTLNDGTDFVTGATVVLLKTDSVLYKFGVSKSNGTFKIKNVKTGDYILQVTYIGYQMHNQNVSISKTMDLGQIVLKEQTENIGQLTIDGETTPILITSDTIAYNANAFKTQPGAVAEDLLKRLPGVEVDRDGTIKAQGEEVQKVTVDGKEFFGKDPQMATKNLPADAIDKIEVYDERSDMSDFTGVDDGQRTKTINLTLKKDRKKGYFGNIEAGYGTEDRFKIRSNINRFTQKTQTSFIGMVNNNNEQGFSFRDYIDFMGGFGNIGRGGRGRINSNDLGLPISSDLGSGFLTTGAAGLNMNHEFKKDTKLNISYFYTNMTKDLERTIDREYIFSGNRPNSFYNQADTQVSNYQNHKIQSIFRHKFNDANSLIWRGGLSYNVAEYQKNSANANISSENVNINNGISDYNSDANTLNYNSELTFRHRFKKKGRSMGVSGSFTNQNSDQDANILSLLNYYNPDSTINIHQEQVQNSQNLNYRANVTFTEPLGKRRYLSLTYTHRNYSKPIDKIFTDRFTNTIIDTLSTQYQNDYYFHKVGASLRKITEKSNLSLGVNGQISKLDGEITNLNYVVDQPAFYFLLPFVNWRYEFGASHYLRADYRTSANEPDIIELQPVLDNTDPLNLYIGDPNLNPEYTHRLRLSYIKFDQFTFSSLYANLTATYTSNDITTIRALDRSSTQLTQPVNVDYNMSLRGFASYSTPIRPIKTNIRINTNMTMQRSISAIANIQDVNDYLAGIPRDLVIEVPQTRYTSSVRLVLDNLNKDIIDISVGGRMSYNNTVYDNPEQANQSFITQNYFAEMFLNLGKNWAVSTKFDYTIYDGEAVGTRQEVPIWEASVRRYVLKNRRAEVRFTAMDILNRNVGINWNSNLNYIEEEVIRSLGRYFMISFKYQIRKVGK